MLQGSTDYVLCKEGSCQFVTQASRATANTDKVQRVAGDLVGKRLKLCYSILTTSLSVTHGNYLKLVVIS